METIHYVKCHGVINMRFSKEVINFTDQLVYNYSKLEVLGEYYLIHISSVPEFEIYELSSLIMASDNCYEEEALGPDNPSFRTKMLPALHLFLKDTTNKDNEIEFVNCWKEGVSDYFRGTIQKLLEERLENYNQEEGYIKEMHVWAA